MGFLSHYPQDLTLAGAQNLPLFLNGGRVDPVLGIHELPPRAGGFLPYPARARQGLPHHGFPGKAAGIEGVLSCPEVTGERLFHNDVLVGFEGLDSHGFVHIGRRADIHYVHCIQQALQGVERRQAVDTGKSLSAFPGPGHDTHHLQRDAKDLLVAGQVKTGGELSPHDADSNS